MALKRQITEEGEESAGLPVKRQHLISKCIFNDANDLREHMPHLELFFRKLVQEVVQGQFAKFQRSTMKHIECPRTLQLQFYDDLPNTMFTGSRVMSEGNSPIKVILFNSISKEIVTSGPHSSIKVNVVVLDGDFGPDDQDWSKKHFDSKIVKNREGKRPLVTGELTVQLKNGVGFIGQVSFTDNSSWIRSGRFRLGAKALPCADEIIIKEALSNPFKVKDHRGESYQKHYPPSLFDEVWRLEKIAKDGSSHKSLTQFGIHSIQDFLRCYETNQLSLRSEVLSNVSHKRWETILKHAATCKLDDKRFMFRTAQGTGLLFNSVFKVVGMSFDGHNFHSVDNLNLNTNQMRMVEDLKQHAYKNMKDWVPVADQSFVGYPRLLANRVDDFSHPNLGLQDAHFQAEHDQLEIQVANHHPTISSPNDFEEEQENSSFETGESSKMPEFNLSLRNSFQMSDSPGIFYGHSWVPEAFCMDSPVDYNFQEG